jgi:hypothetical protein
MEKTANIKVSLEEKRNWKNEELRKRADSLLENFLSSRLKLYRFEEKIEKILPEDKRTLIKFLLDGLLKRVQIDITPKEVFLALSKVLKDNYSDFISKIESHILLYQKELNKKKEEISKEILEDLKLKGISGSAVVPNLSLKDAWRTSLKKLNQEFSSQKELLKEEFLQIVA